MALRIGLDVKLHYNKMTEAQLTNLATRFRQAIVTAKKKRAFLRNDRMSEFPRGCCDDTADLFSHYLYHEYGTVSIRIDGSYHVSVKPETSRLRTQVLRLLHSQQAGCICDDTMHCKLANYE